MTRDDVARNIRNEMNRDAAPSAEEVAAMEKRYLRENGCQHEGCDVNDPEQLRIQQTSYRHSCPKRQTGPPELEPFCSDHEPDTSREQYIEDRIESYRESHETRDDITYYVIVVYECDTVKAIGELHRETYEATQQIDVDDDGDPVYEKVEQVDTRLPPFMKVPPVHSCGATLESVHVLDAEVEE